jgi:hypothetical protein
LGIIPDEDGTVEVCVDGVVLRTVEDVSALLPMVRPDLHTITLVTGLFARALEKPQPKSKLAPSPPPPQPTPSELPWERVPSLRAKTQELLKTHVLLEEPCSVWNGVRPVYMLKTMARAVFDKVPFSDLRVIRVRRTSPDPDSNPDSPTNPYPNIELGVAKTLLRQAPAHVVGVANVVLEDFGRSGVAICTHARDARGPIPAWFKHPVPNKLVCMPTLYPWDRRTVPVLHIGRPAEGLVHVLGTLLQPWAANWYRSFRGKLCVFNGYPLSVDDDASSPRDEGAVFFFGYDGGEDTAGSGTVMERDCPIDPDQTLRVHTYGDFGSGLSSGSGSGSGSGFMK